MSYKAELQNNNARLQGILDQIENMPEGGGGGGGSTFETSAVGRIPEYDHGFATAELNGSIFEASAVGAVN